MKGLNYRVLIVLAFAVTLIMAANGVAQGLPGSPVPVMVAVGSSAQYQMWGEAAVQGGGATPNGCGATVGVLAATQRNIWTQHNGAYGKDNRPGAINEVKGDIWVVWDGAANGTTATVVCTYLNVDSGVGQRLFFAQPQGSIDFTGLVNCAAPPAGGNQVVIPAAGTPIEPNGTPAAPDVALPTNVCNAVQGAVFTAAPTDIRPEDALFATNRALTSLGYGPGPIGSSFIEYYGTKTFQAVGFNISGNDPITNDAIPGYTVTNVGGCNVMVIVENTDNGASGGLGFQTAGVYDFQNITRANLAKVLDGTLWQTSDITVPPAGGHKPLQIVQREALSGTFNTIEWSVPNSVEFNTTQERCIDTTNPANPSTCAGIAGNGNPLYFTGPGGGTKGRAIGTGDMILAVGGAPSAGVVTVDAIGYAFWGFGNFAKETNGATWQGGAHGTAGGANGWVRYLQVDGVDPILKTYVDGTIPLCLPGPTCTDIITHPNLVNGTYPIWNILRVTTATPVPGEVSNLVTQLDFDSIPDVIPYASMAVFRSHYAQSGVLPKDGVCHPAAGEAGGDMGGSIFTKNADLDYCHNFGLEFTGLKQ
jgi:hypothetical protein